MVATLQERLICGYREAGFPNIEVAPTIDEAAGKIRVRIVEGQRFARGKIIISGETKDRLEAIHSVLTSERPAPPRGIQRIGQNAPAPREPLPPFWESGTWFPFGEQIRDRLQQEIETELMRMGYFHADVEIELERAVETHTVNAHVTITELGPPGRMGRLVVDGLERNALTDIENLVDLPEGTPLDLTRVGEVKQLLMNTGRFSLCRTDVAPIDGSDRVNVVVQVKENSAAPLLKVATGPNGQFVRQLHAWAHTPALEKTEFDLEQHFPDSIWKRNRMIMAGQAGMYWRFEVEWEPFTGSYVVVLTPERIILVDRNLKRRLEFATPNIQLTASVVLQSTDDHAWRPQLLFNVTRRSSAEDPPFRLTHQLALDAALAMVQAVDAELEEREKGLVLRWDWGEVLSERQSGRPLACRFQRENLQVRIRSGTGFLREALADLDRDEGIAPRKVKWDEAVAVLASDYLVPVGRKLFDQETDLGPPQRQAAQAGVQLLARVLTSALRESVLFAAKEEEAPAEGEPFPLQMPPEFHMSNLMAGFSPIGATVADEAFPRYSWPWTLTRETMFYVAGATRYTQAELQRLYESPEMGPVGSLTLAALLDLGGMKQASETFAMRGQKALSAERLNKELQALLHDDSALRHLITLVLKKLQNLNEQDRKLLIMLLAPEHRRLGKKLLQQMQSAEGLDLQKLSSTAVLLFWDSHLQPLLKRGLNGYLPEWMRETPPPEEQTREWDF
jgi:hypothetical protein